MNMFDRKNIYYNSINKRKLSFEEIKAYEYIKELEYKIEKIEDFNNEVLMKMKNIQKTFDQTLILPFSLPLKSLINKMEADMNYEGILDNIIELAHDKLNDWEVGFIDDINTRYCDNYDKLSSAQKENILKIQDKYLKF